MSETKRLYGMTFVVVVWLLLGLVAAGFGVEVFEWWTGASST